jgi:hypothetical protein
MYIPSSGSGFTGVNVYTGIDNEDRTPPAVTVWCKGINEVVFNSRCYAFDVDITVKEMAADTIVDDYSSLAGNVFAYFADSVSGSAALTSTTTGLRVWQIQMVSYDNNVSGDTWTNNLSLKLIGALVPS